jgi:DNA-binding PadR family transcriptional regulator
MEQGVSSREEVRLEILRLLSDRGKLKNAEIVHALKEKASKGTLLKYLEALVREKYVSKNPGSLEDSFRPVYSITEEGRKELSRMVALRLCESSAGTAFVLAENKEELDRTFLNMLPRLLELHGVKVSDGGYLISIQGNALHFAQPGKSRRK